MKSIKRIYVYFDDGFNSLQFLGDFDSFINAPSDKIIRDARETYLNLYTELYKFNISARLENYNKVIFTNELEPAMSKKNKTISPKKDTVRIPIDTEVKEKSYKKFEHPMISYD